MSLSLAIGAGVSYVTGALGSPSVKRSIGPYTAQVTIEEEHTDELFITDHPVEQGAAISDHAYKKPAEVVIRCGWSNSAPNGIGSLLNGQFGGIGSAAIGAVASAGGAAVTAGLSLASGLLSSNSPFAAGLGGAASSVKDVYNQLLALQASLTTFTIVTGKRTYNNMLIQSLRVTTDLKSENALFVTARCREIIQVSTTTVTLAQNSNMANAAVNGGIVSTGSNSTVAGTAANTNDPAFSQPPPGYS